MHPDLVRDLHLFYPEIAITVTLLLVVSRTCLYRGPVEASLSF